MKIAIIADLHCEFSEWVWPDETECDVIINAGDTHPWPLQRDLKRKSFPDKPYIEVLGNHDYYGQQELAYCSSAYRVDDTKFFGTTLWTDLDLAQFELVKNSLADSRQIVNYTYEKMGELFTRGLDDILKSNADVIVTHHGPSFKSCSIKYQGSPLNCGFYSSLDDFILDMEKPPVLWVHGHTHDSSDYMIGKTRVVCHPRGYPHEVNHRNYKPKVIEI